MDIGGTIMALLSGTGISVVLGYAAGRRKTAAETRKTIKEAEAIEIESVKKIIAMWQELAASFKKDVERLEHHVNELKAENRLLKKQIHDLDQKIN